MRCVFRKQKKNKTYTMCAECDSKQIPSIKNKENTSKAETSEI